MQGFELSVQQRRLWSAEGDHGALRCQCAVELDAQPEAVQAALRKIVERHEALRTACYRVPGRRAPLQVVASEPQFVWEARHLPGDGAEAGQALWQLRQEAPPVEETPLRARLLTSPRRRLLLLDLPAFCGDGRTLFNLVDELAAFLAGRRPTADDSIQYVDYCEWQRDLEEEDAAREYWRLQASGHAKAVALPLERDGEAFPASRFAPESFNVPLGRARAAALERIGAGVGSGLPLAVFACFQSLVARLTGSEEVILGHGFDGRAYEPLQGAMGLYARFLPVRCRVDPQLSLREILEQAAAAVEAGARWQDSTPRNGDAPSPPPICFDFADFQQACLPVVAWHGCTDRFHLKLTLAALGAETVLQWYYDTARLDRAAVREMARQFDALLDSAAAAGTRPVGSLPLVDRFDRHRLLIERNDTAATLRPIWLPWAIEEQAARAPQAPALRFGGCEISYRELDRRADLLARRLRAMGVAPGAVVALWLERSPLAIEAVLAVWKAGAAYLALDPEAPTALARRLLATAACRMVLTQGALAGSLPELDGTVLCLDDDSAPPAGGDPAGPVPVALEMPAYAVATSGTTGEPKAVLCHHAGVANYLAYLAAAYRLGPGDTVLQIAALSFDASVRDLFGPLAAGARVVLPGKEEAKSLSTMLALIREHEVDCLLSIVPTLLRALVGALEREDGRCPSVRLVLVSGEPLFAADCDRARAVFAEDVEIVNQYGPTECTMTSTYFRVPESMDEGILPLGEPIPNGSVHLLDEELDPVPVGLPGEIFLGGPGLTYGYLGRSDLTAAAFIPMPFGGVPGERLYRTGDLGRRLPDGRLEFLGRRDRQVKVRGVRVELEGVESLLRQHPEVRDVAVVVARGEDAGEVRLVGYLVAASETPPAIGELRSFLLASLPEPMVPSSWVFLPSLPLTRTGKVDRAALPEPAAISPGSESVFRAARNPAEELLAEIWAQVLGVERVSIHDNFFELGGQSFLAMQIVSRTRQAFGVEVPLRSLFEKPTVAGLAGEVQAATGAPAPPLVPVADPPRELPLSFLQERYWVVQSNLPRGGFYRLAGPLDMPSLARSFAAVVERHRSLKTAFRVVDDRPVQVVLPGAHLPARMVDLTALPEALRADEAERTVGQARLEPLDPGRAPLLWYVLVRLGAQEHWLALLTHHILFDGWSWGILHMEVAALYRAMQEGATASLPALPIQYADFVLWQRGCWNAERVEAELAFWQHRLEGAPPLLEALADLPRTRGRDQAGHQIPLRLDAATTEVLRSLGRRQSATLFMTLLALFKVLLYRFSGLDDITVVSFATGRNRVETEGLIGLFAGQVALRTRLRGEESFLAALGRVQAVTIEAFARQQDFPLEKVVADLYSKIDLRHVQQVVFGYGPDLNREQTLDLPGLDVERLFGKRRGDAGELALQARESREGISGFVYCDAGRFLPTTAERLARQFEWLAREVVDRPQTSLESLRDALVEMESRQWEQRAEQVQAASLRKLRRSLGRSAAASEPTFSPLAAPGEAE